MAKKMLQWLRLVVMLLLCAAVRGKELECDQAYNEYCTNLKTQQRELCLVCVIKNQQISESDEMIFINHPDDVEVVLFTRGYIPKMQKFIQKSDNKEILLVQLSDTGLLNSQFFGNAGENLTFFGNGFNDNLSVEAFTFQNCKSLEHLDLSLNTDSTNIAPDAFRGLYKLIKLNLVSNDLSLVLKDWFNDMGNLEFLLLGHNQLKEISDDTFKSLAKLKRLYLESNRFQIITKYMFQHNKQLQEISFRSNRISQIQSGAFANLSQLIKLDLKSTGSLETKPRKKLLRD